MNLIVQKFCGGFIIGFIFCAGVENILKSSDWHGPIMEVISCLLGGLLVIIDLALLGYPW